MAVKQMTKTQVAGGYTYEYSGTLASATSGDSILIPPGVRDVSVTVVITTGSAKVQYTNDSVADVVAGSPNWVDWNYGTISATNGNRCAPCTAIKLVQTTAGATAIEVQAR